MDLHIKRHDYELNPDMTRVVCQFFNPGSEYRIQRIAQRVSALDAKKSENEINAIFKDFSPRHKNFSKLIENHFHKIEPLLSADIILTDRQKELMGAYCSCEYSFESAALMNPSMVPAQNKDEFILSLRQVGEGHISSIGFRNGTINKNGEITLEEASTYAQLPEIDDSGNELRLHFEDGSLLSERIIFPATPDECNGMEDARFVKFEDDLYYATYTAYDGHNISIKLLITKDFLDFNIKKIHGKAVNNKGMALFPEKIDEKYAMISRQDGENLYYMSSDDITHWENSSLLDKPHESWEFVQIGNCGSPIKTNEGWILLTHGVGAMRKYVISACLLDLYNPSKVVGRLQNPLLLPDEDEREGYVPNVVYSCGALMNKQDLIIPYAMSDYRSGFASLDVNDLISQMK